MPVNPATKPEHLNSPIERANDLNSPEFQNQEGYYPYDLTHAEYLTPLFGKITPNMHLITAPGDRHVVRNNVKTILNRINGNFLSTVNQYVDSFYVPFRSVFPTNFEKLLPNPTKGDDLPNSALPQFPLAMFIYNYCFGRGSIGHNDLIEGESYYDEADVQLIPGISSATAWERQVRLGRLVYIATMLSRGQLLDYLGIGFDLEETDSRGNSIFQQHIDNFFQQLWNVMYANIQEDPEISYLSSASMLPTDVVLDTTSVDQYFPLTLSEFRQTIDDILEKGRFPLFYFRDADYENDDFVLSYDYLVGKLQTIFARGEFYPFDSFDDYVDNVDSVSNPFANGGYVNIGLVLAYQQVIAQYFTNDSVDNIFNSDLYMQNLRSVMFPTGSSSRYTREPVFSYNGVSTEYDYISAASSYSALIDYTSGVTTRQMIYISLMFLLRRSLRYGDYFATARPRMLAVGDLTISAEDGVSPIDVTQNLLKQRYLNAVNYTGSGFLKYYASQFGVTPSDTTTYPRFLSHKKLPLMNQITNNTAENQGAQTTNLVGYDDSSIGFDVFIDDIGYLVQVISYDVLPVYTSGIDSSYHLADRFDYFNPMLQNIGDQPIRLSELVGNPIYYDKTFGYTMRNAEYKFKLSKAHGGFVNNDLAGYLMKYPFKDFEIPIDGTSGQLDIRISPDFIRDKSYYLDNSIPAITGASPATYYHFVVACVNEVQSARKIQKTPPILF